MRLGADDYLTKDTSMEFLVIRIQALLKRFQALSASNEAERDRIECGDLVLDMDQLTAWWKGAALELSLTQFWMVHQLARQPGQVSSHADLMRAASIVVEPNTIAAHIKHIREQFKNIDPGFACIKTERGIGYRWLRD
jgi:two-component system OmpR family response regulator